MVGGIVTIVLPFDEMKPKPTRKRVEHYPLQISTQETQFKKLLKKLHRVLKVVLPGGPLVCTSGTASPYIKLRLRGW